jgi:hypothetical protein
MNETEHGHNQYADPNNGTVHHGHSPYWKRAHRDWRIWVGVVLMLAAMIVYVMSDDLALRPRIQSQQPLSGAIGK